VGEKETQQQNVVGIKGGGVSEGTGLNLGYFFENGNSVFKFQGDFKGWGII
jgi:hypothetical protein